MNTTLPRSSIVAVWRQHPLATTVAAGVGLAVGVLLTFSALSGASGAGDEPPIRVKNGSLDLDLPKGSGRWEKESDAKHWKIAGNKEKKSTDFTVALFPDPGKTCAATTATGSSVVITYSDGNTVTNTVTLDIQNKKTKVKATADLSNSQPVELLTYTAGGYIKDITVGSTSMCTFNSASELSVALIWY